MKKESILESIYNDIDQINWTSNNVKSKAIKFAMVLFNTSLFRFKSLDEFKPLSKEYWSTVIGGSNRHINEIKSKLVSNKILDVKAKLYKKDSRVLSYKFNNKYINNYSFNSAYTIIVVSFSKVLKTNELQIIEEATTNTIKNIRCQLTPYVKVSIDTIVEQQIDKIKIFDLSLTEQEFIKVKLEDITYRYSVGNAVKFAETVNKILIKYKDKYYFVDSIENFKEYKRKELTMLYTKQLFDIENNIIYASRNETNNRLDSNVTNLKSELWDFLTLDNEKFVEIDITNSQFAIAANIINVDDNFKQLAIDGYLYEYIAFELNITRKQAKSLMMKIAFDKVKIEQDCIRNLFPIFMNSVDTYKKEKGYNMFANLLQKEESNIMIDNVLLTLLNEGYDVLSVHDSIRCKKTDYEKVLNRINEIFTQINFKCTLKNKSINILEEKEISLEEPKTLKEEVYTATKEDYLNQIKKYHPTIETIRFFKENKNEILNELVSKQLNKKSDIIKIVTKYNL
jgi:hypothetical protein